jgi:hypothetical protein
MEDTVSRPYLELPEAAEKVIQTLRVYDDPPYGREVHIAFRDGTQISIDLVVETAVHAKYYRERVADLELLLEHHDPAPSED